MSPSETVLDLAQRHLSEAEARTERQRQIIAEMERDNHFEAARRARDLLATFCQTVKALRAHIANLQASDPEPRRES